MSTYWGLRCEQCGVDSPTWFNHGDDFLRELVKQWPTLIRPLLNATNLGGKLWRLELRMMGYCEDPTPLEFLEEHDGHPIALQNEYGKVEPIEPEETSE